MAATAGPLALRGAVSTAVLYPVAGQPLLAALRRAAEGGPPVQVLLLLECIRGSRDAPVLTVCLNLPPGSSLAQFPQAVVGSLGLFGLRLASLAQAGRPGQGRNAFFDVTPQLIGNLTAAGAEIRLSIVPSQLLPAESDLVIGQARLYIVPLP